MKLLVCIAYHNSTPGKDNDRLKYLYAVQRNLAKYECEVEIIIDTNYRGVGSDIPGFQCIGHENLSHPFHLTMMHREHFKKEIDNYDWFYFLEDDMLLPYENFLRYTEKFSDHWKYGYVPSFIRIEQKDGIDYVSDVIKTHDSNNRIPRPEKCFYAFPFPENYHAFWIMPQKELKESITDDFTRLHDSRELAASYPSWTLKKTPVVEIEQIKEKWQVKENCFAYHLPSNYIDSPMPNGKIKVKEIFI